MSLAFLLTSLAIVATPGTGVVLTVAAGLRGGVRASLVTALGCTLGIVPHLVAAVTGTAALLRAGGHAFEVLKVAGVLYLLYMAWSTWRHSGVLAVEDEQAPTPPLRRIVNAVLANLLNPKLTLFFFAFLPQFVSPGQSALAQMTGLGAVFMAMTFVVFALYGWGAAAVRRHVVGRPRVVRRLQRAFSLSYLGLGVRLATVHR
ncbi:LysE family translocator [Cellulomonas alba]|uniref:LysE family translocator n=1 Tax=Cellulomonas alba TaxID=3053467 RepID=A0ABT7SI40_9CELL|nr:LysE family translocator [Cellulomonas alba]MDM7855846.1 LysE family translocator [Cellulomonas alba]